jgi:SAM-dependent methyltransferase
MEKNVYEEMYWCEETYWWFVAKRKIILHLLNEVLPMHMDRKSVRVCDIGCGCGATAKALSREYHVCGFDASDDAIRFCKDRGVAVNKGELPDLIPFSENTFDVVLLLDVLEHIDNDVAAVKSAVSLLKAGGIMICTVPAYQLLWSAHDEVHHHRRRYSRRDFCRLLDLPRVKMIKCGYYCSLLFPLALIERILSKIIAAKTPRSDVPPIPKLVNAVLGKVFAFERFLLLRTSFPYGLSLIGVLQKET